ncbi:ATP-binding protein [Streptomyces sp. Li-HN-5-13]|nr:ATP-binding protein [Streptomyces sp. Li-HN-5-13]
MDNDESSGRDGLIRACAAYRGSPPDIAAARDLTQEFLARVQSVHGLLLAPPTADAVRLVVSELVTNACKHTSGPCVLELRADRSAVKVVVSDAEPVLPVIEEADPRRVGRHGLEIVLSLCDRLTFDRTPVGKCVTAVVPLPSRPSRGSMRRAAWPP